jgi:peptidoglycan/xylan/chitin deacetylase (PgdA/CDA1 family)
MTVNNSRRRFLRLVGGAFASAPVLGAAAGCDPGKPDAAAMSTPTAAPMATFPPGATTPDTNIPRLAEAGRLHAGARRNDLEVIWQLDTEQKIVALTFDDGPDPKVSKLLYDILDETMTKATFFLVGRRVVQYAKLLHGRMDRHEVGNHTYTHQSLFLKDDIAALKDLNDAHKAITAVVGREPRLLRPPYSHVNGNTLIAAAALGYDIVMWNQHIGDQEYASDEPKLVEDVVNATSPGSIVLGHDAGDRRLIAIRNLPKIIQQLRRRKYEFVTISELRAASR